jgi:hypothetical protein
MTDHRTALTTEREVSLVEVLDRALGAGVVITGDLTISLADVDLVYLDLRLVLASVGTFFDERGDAADAELLSLGRGHEDSR